MVVEDEDDIGRLLKLDGTEWSLLVLDLRPPGLDGMEICGRVRASTTFIRYCMRESFTRLATGLAELARRLAIPLADSANSVRR